RAGGSAKSFLAPKPDTYFLLAASTSSTICDMDIPFAVERAKPSRKELLFRSSRVLILKFPPQQPLHAIQLRNWSTLFLRALAGSLWHSQCRGLALNFRCISGLDNYA